MKQILNIAFAKSQLDLKNGIYYLSENIGIKQDWSRWINHYVISGKKKVEQGMETCRIKPTSSGE